MGKAKEKRVRWRDLDQRTLDMAATIYFGRDAVALKDPPAMRGVSVAWLLWILFFGAWLLVPIAGWRAPTRSNIIVAGAFWAVAVLVVVGVEVASLVSIARTRALLEAPGPFTPAMAAKRALRRVMKFTWRRRCFDTAGYFRDLGKERAPRVVFVRCISSKPDASDVYEDVDLCGGRAVSKQMVRRVQGKIVWLVFWMGVIYWLSWRHLTPLQIMQSPLFLAYMAYIAWVLSHIGWVPFHLRSAVANVRGVTFAGWFTPRGEFNRDNSVLLVDRRGAVRARLCRLDGKVGSLTFRGGTDDPGLEQLLARWTFKAKRSDPNGATRAGVGANDSSEEADDERRTDEHVTQL